LAPSSCSFNAGTLLLCCVIAVLLLFAVCPACDTGKSCLTVTSTTHIRKHKTLSTIVRILATLPKFTIANKAKPGTRSIRYSQTHPLAMEGSLYWPVVHHSPCGRTKKLLKEHGCHLKAPANALIIFERKGHGLQKENVYRRLAKSPELASCWSLQQ
jgi:hypothetical protein